MMPRPTARFDRALFSLVAPLVAPLVACAAAATPVGCGGAPAAPQAPASSATAAAVALPPAPDLSPVPEPQGLVVSGTISKLGASLATVGGWTQLPMPGAETVTNVLADEDLGAIADLDRPIDFAVTVSGIGAHVNSSLGASAAVRDVEAAKATLAEHHKLVPAANGALLIEPLASRPHPAEDTGDDSSDEGGHACELAPSYGEGAFRLVCAGDAKELAALGPWLTRGATRATTTYDAHVDVRMQPLKPTIAEERRLFALLLGTVLGGRLGISGARDVAQAIGGDVIDFGTDLDTASLDLALSDPGAAATLTLRFSGSASVLGRLMTANADRNGPPPATFWQMPADTDIAMFDRGIDASVIARGRDLVLKVVGDKLAADGVKDADRHALVDALGAIATSAPVVYASGIDADAVRKALAGKTPASTGRAAPADASAADRALLHALLGWRILEIDEPASVKVDAMKAIVAALSRPGVVAAYHAKPGARALAMRSSPLPKGSALAKGTEHFVIEVPLPESESPPASGKAAAPKTLGLDVFIVPDGTRSWIGVGSDPSLVAAKLAASVGGSGDTLAAKPELASMKDAVVGAGGFFTVRATAYLAAQVSALGGGGDLESLSFLDGTTHQGLTPIPFSLTAPAATPGTAVATLQVPRGTVEDVVMGVIQHHGF
ncbi:MAG TPA: hypothetical protein VK762_29310 [Polyangiaceae bacterium]|nr:hypothetical protein [Polyangiaceae bacterium]